MLLPILTKFLITTGILLLIRFIYKYIVKPYLLLQELKKIKGAVYIYKPFFGLYPQYRKDFIKHNDFYHSTKKRLRENKGMRFLATPTMDTLTIELYDPELVKEFTAKQPKSFVKDMRIYGVMPEGVKNGIAFSDGEKWKYQRKMLAQIFHFDYMNACIPLVNNVVNGWIQRYCKDSRSIVEVNATFKMYAAEIVFNVFFGEDSFYSIPDAQKAVKTALKMMDDMIQLAQSPKNLIFGHKFINWGLGKIEREYMSDTKFLNEFLYQQLQTLKKKHEGEKELGKPDSKRWKTLIECLLEEAPKSGLSEKEFEIEMLSEIISFFIAGIDTTANSLAMTQYFLSIYPEMQQRLRNEISRAIAPGEMVTREHIMSLNYLNAFYKEVLRHSGPAGILFPRRATEDVMLGDLKIKKEFSVVVSVIGMHHSLNNFSDPEVFNPDRWLVKSEEGTSNPYGSIPFSIGQRKCLGEPLAVIEAKTMIIELVRRFKISLEQPYELKMGFGVAYQPYGKLDIIYERI